MNSRSPMLTECEVMLYELDYTIRKKSMNEAAAFETWMRNRFRKQKDIEDQKILDEMLSELKKKNEAKKQKEVDDLHIRLKKMEC